MANDEITTRDLFDKWQDMDDKLEKLNEKIDDVTENGVINTQVSGSIVENKSLRLRGKIGGGLTKNFVETRGEIVIQELVMKFEKDSTMNRFRMESWQNGRFDYLYLGVQRLSANVYPSEMDNSSLFDVIEESENFIVRLNKPLKLKGFRMYATNTDSEERQIEAIILYSEVN